MYTTQDKLISPYHGSSGGLVWSLNLEPFDSKVDVSVTPKMPQSSYHHMSPECSMSLMTELCIVLSSECVHSDHSRLLCRVLNPTSRRAKYTHSRTSLLRHITTLAGLVWGLNLEPFDSKVDVVPVTSMQ